MKIQNVCRLWHSKDYLKSHISLQVTMTVLALLLVAGLILQSFVKNRYFAYLLRETRNTEWSAMEASAANANNMLRDLVNTACKIAVDSTLYENVKLARAEDEGQDRRLLTLGTELNSISHYTEDIAAVTVVTDEGVLLEYGRYWAGSGYKNLWTDVTEDALMELYGRELELLEGASDVRYCVATEPSAHPNLPDMQLFHMAVPLIGKTASYEKAEAVIVLSFRLDNVFEAAALAGTHRGELAAAYLTDASGRIICREDGGLIGENVDDYAASMKDNEQISQPLDYFGWTAGITIDIAEMRREVDRLYRQSIVVYLLLLFACGVIWQVVIRHILRPVGLIRGAMEKIRLGGDMPKIEVKGSHEIWQLADHYNEMVDELARQQEEIQRSYKERTLSIEQRNRAEMEALESQINAHFLCNTLAAINYNAVEKGDDEVALLLKKLSGILAYAFSRKLVVVTLGQEIQWVEQYLYLQKFRLMEVFDYEIDFPQEYGEWPCCKLFLQPFVENSILHGFEGIESNGRILISGRIDGKRFLLTVEDNGCGMEPEVEQIIQKILNETHALDLSGTGIGIQNVITRLRMYYGSQFAVQMQTCRGRGTRFSFWLPIPPEAAERR